LNRDVHLMNLLELFISCLRALTTISQKEDASGLARD